MLKSDRVRTLMRPLSGYLVAATSVGIAAFITLKLGSVVKHTSTLFFCSVMLSSWYGGLCPGVFSALLSVLALDYYFIPPLYALGISLEEAPDMFVFVATALFIGWLNGEQKRAKESLRRARDELETKVQERTAELKRANGQLPSEIAERASVEVGLIQAQAESHDERRESHARSHRSGAGPAYSGRRAARGYYCRPGTRFRCGPRPKTFEPHVRGVLYHEGAGHRHGFDHQSFDHRGTRRPTLGCC